MIRAHFRCGVLQLGLSRSKQIVCDGRLIHVRLDQVSQSCSDFLLEWCSVMCSLGSKSLPVPVQLTLDHVSPATRFLEKQEQMRTVQRNLEKQKDEYSRKEELFKRKEEGLRKRDLELQEALVLFDKFLRVFPRVFAIAAQTGFAGKRAQTAARGAPGR